MCVYISLPIDVFSRIACSIKARAGDKAPVVLVATHLDDPVFANDPAKAQEMLSRVRHFLPC